MYDDKILKEVLKARERVYRAGKPTPFEKWPLDDRFTTFVKREDLSEIKAYKWRGAYNAASVYYESEKPDMLVAASAGNHAQGVAIAAQKLKIPAKIFMPTSTPKMKQNAVRRLGKDWVDIVLVGDDYNEASAAAMDYLENNPAKYIHPYDDLYTIAGQATIADEIVLSGQGPFDFAFVQIGGGGMAAGVSLWLKTHYPQIKIIGVEGVDQASMKASIAANKPVTLDFVDAFCDGTAVTRPGDLCFDICRETLDDIITVTNEEVCAAIEKMWSLKRAIPEPAGAMGVAGLIQYARNFPQALDNKKVISIVCGANMDFGKLAVISRRSSVGAHTRRYFRFEIDEDKGTLLELLERVRSRFDIREFQYGKSHLKKAYPVIAFEGEREKIDSIDTIFDELGCKFEDVTNDADIRYRIIHYEPSMMSLPLFFHVHFPERDGALSDFLRDVSHSTSICYFNYYHTGESIGRALMGFEFQSEEQKKQFLDLVDRSVVKVSLVNQGVQARLMGSGNEIRT